MSEEPSTTRITLTFSLPTSKADAADKLKAYLKQNLIGLSIEEPLVKADHGWNVTAKFQEGIAASTLTALDTLENTLGKYMIIAEVQSKELKEKLNTEAENKKKDLEVEIAEKRKALEELNKAIAETEQEKDDLLNETKASETPLPSNVENNSVINV